MEHKQPSPPSLSFIACLNLYMYTHVPRSFTDGAKNKAVRYRTQRGVYFVTKEKQT